MKMKNTVISVIIAVTQSKWIRPALMTLALLVAVLGVTGCNRTTDPSFNNETNTAQQNERHSYENETQHPQ